ncbi:hypothetical protein CDAR_179411 [Caerostris darwini]|uniref:Uncharacterized protein n=1 Tax=Caerostris darwini TaxID=1538125 RepID=A0AAV4SC26_9ARAC|nr:hypothetical protein CDAR_179411 [Caerostris darwini]
MQKPAILVRTLLAEDDTLKEEAIVIENKLDENLRIEIYKEVKKWYGSIEYQISCLWKAISEIRKISISDCDEDSSSSESAPSTRSRFSRLRITDDIEEGGLYESTKDEVEMSTSAVMSCTSLLEETPEVESFDSEKKRTASPTFDPSLPGPSGYGQITCADMLYDGKCLKRMEPIEEKESDEIEESSSEYDVPCSDNPVSPTPVGGMPSNTRRLMNISPFELQKKQEQIAYYFPESMASTPPSSPEMFDMDILGFEPVIISDTESDASDSSSAACSSSSSDERSFESFRIEPVKEDKPFENLKKFLQAKSVKRKIECSSSVLPSTTISSSMQNTSEASSVHEPKAQTNEESLELEAGRKRKKIKLEEIAPASNLPGTSISSSSACKSIESDVKGLEEPKSGKKRKRKTKCSPVLPMITISSGMRNTSEASSVHEHNIESDVRGLEEPKSGKKRKRKTKCSSVLTLTTIRSSMRNTSEASSVHEHKY